VSVSVEFLDGAINSHFFGSRVLVLKADFWVGDFTFFFLFRGGEGEHSLKF
jgi:hypothetical protein